MLIARPLRLESPADVSAVSQRITRQLSGGFALRAVLLTGLDDISRQALRGGDEFPRYFAGERPGTGLLVGRAEQFRTLQLAVGRAHPELASALEHAERVTTAPAPLLLGGERFEWGSRTFVMGVVNVTPDSFSDGGRFLSPEAALAQAAQLIQAGADLLDIGGESTRPGAQPVSEAEEQRRVVPVIEALHRRFPRTPISVDTSKPSVARAAVHAGAGLVNDVTAFGDPAMARAVAELGVPAIVMHMKGTPSTMQQQPEYEDVVGEVIEALEATAQRAVAAGVARERLLVDPGIGFGKTFDHNLYLLKHLTQLRVLGAPVVVGTSRKAFLGALTGKAAPDRAVASAASAAIVAVLGGADLVRVHDVAETREALAVADAVRTARDGGRAWG